MLGALEPKFRLQNPWGNSPRSSEDCWVLNFKIGRLPISILEMRGTKSPNNSRCSGSIAGKCSRSALQSASVMGLLGTQAPGTRGAQPEGEQIGERVAEKQGVVRLYGCRSREDGECRRPLRSAVGEILQPMNLDGKVSGSPRALEHLLSSEY
jgi:hypothetical protein